ncbi:hypothetical protein [Paenarthrobacter sp. NPDC091669]|uniref:hypothetical protein n=1 Tax=Paenarthrobacter sp. NPDC091669 TaxID=3364384 RepID=UPI00380E6B52
MQQIFSIGNFTGAMLVAWLAMATGGWLSTWWITVTFAALGIALSLALHENEIHSSFPLD